MPVNVSDMIVNISQQSAQFDWNTFWTTLSSGFVTLAAAFLGSFVTFKIYQQDKFEKMAKENQLKEEEKVKNLNFLLIQLLVCINNTLTNIKTVEEQKEAYENMYNKVSRYVCKNNCNIEIIKDSSKQFIIELPGVVHNLNSLEERLEWAKIYRDRRNKLMNDHGSQEAYEGLSKIEFDWHKETLEIMIPNILVIYDFAVNNFGDRYTILKISENTYLKDVWKYLPEDFKEINIKSKLQYSIKNEAITKWFFEVLQKEQEKEQEEEESITNEQEL